jgi:hypothetical protein
MIAGNVHETRMKNWPLCRLVMLALVVVGTGCGATPDKLYDAGCQAVLKHDPKEAIRVLSLALDLKPKDAPKDVWILTKRGVRAGQSVSGRHQRPRQRDRAAARELGGALAPGAALARDKPFA